MTKFSEFTEYRTKRDFFNHCHISFRNKYVYFGVAKAANSTIKYYLQKIEYQNTPYTVKNVHDKHYSPLLSPYQLDDAEFHAAMYGSEYKRFTLVRNPYARLLSCFLDRVQDTKSASYRNIMKHAGRDPREFSFQEFVGLIGTQKVKEMDCHWRPQVYETYHGRIKMDSVLKFEDLPANLTEIISLTSCSDESIFAEKANKSPSVTSAGKRLDEYYTGDIADMANEIYSEDFAAFNYSKLLA